MLKGKFVELEKISGIWEEFKKLEEYDFLLVKFSKFPNLYVIFFSDQEEMHASIKLHAKQWTKTSLGDPSLYCYRDNDSKGNTIEALKEVWGEVEVEEDSATATTIPKR